MEKTNRMPQIYGYLICLVSVITFIICLANIIPAIIDLGDPLHSRSIYTIQNSPSLASFENYKMDILKSFDKDSGGDHAYIPDDQTIRAMYESAKAEVIRTVVHNSVRTIIVSGIIILVSIVLFFSHLNWMRRLSKQISGNTSN